ncbi:hypothetical protein DY000_02046409 [Brassica cretica]|uniref:Protein kinase domain-containing protein n=1 Tax=Brassica cretica TaxID=69181 RepID=A0ABQ7EN64_BRACR|nr:hypothetical protein DY000_02046409 [Brassica cretica]
MYTEDDQAHMELNRKASEPTTVPASHNQQRSSVSAKSKEQDKGTASSTVKGAFQIKLSNPFSALDLATDTDDDMCLNPSYNLICNEKEELLFGNIEVINMSPSRELRVWKNISYTCYDRQGTLADYSYYTTSLECGSRPPPENGDCNGEGCCMTDVFVPLGSREYRTRPARLASMTSVYDFNPCIYAFLTENGTFHFDALEDLKNLRNVKSSPWYNCKCLGGFEGNPYLSNEHGCQDINECTTVWIPGSVETRLEASIVSAELVTEFECAFGRTKAEVSRDFQAENLRTIIGFLSLLLLISCVQQRMKQRKTAELRQKFFQQNGGVMLIQRLSGGGTSNANVKIFIEEGMKTSTNSYDESRILGQGGQGTVYEGILPDNSIVAIQKARLGDNSQVEQFINEVLVLSQINHRNVVKLLGCCLETEVPCYL